MGLVRIFLSFSNITSGKQTINGIIIPVAIRTLKNNERFFLDYSPSLFSIILKFKNKNN